jgi:hypothetical protein
VAGRERVLSTEDLRRAVLARQLLVERSRATIPRALERMAGLQAQYAPSMYIGLWSRVAGFERDALTRLLEQRVVVQATLLRATIHLVAAEDYWPFAVAVRDARRAWFLRAARSGEAVADYEAAGARLRAALADGPLKRQEIEALVGRPLFGGIGMFVDLVRVPPSGTWERRRADLFGLAEDWVGPPTVDVDAAREHLVRRYLGGFGPSTVNEIADWAGLPVKETQAVLERLELRRFRHEDGSVLVDLPRAPLPPEGAEPPPVRFLPTWDALLLAHARRSLVLPEEHRPKIFNTKMPQSIGTFLVDGQVAGTWRFASGTVKTEPFAPLPAAARDAVADEAARLADLHA